MKEMVNHMKTDIAFEYICNENPAVNDQLMAGLTERSIVINATGMGKDTPGSPITDEGVFPKNGIAWEFNYRGELDFMHQAERQIKKRHLTVKDGWLYFVHGWTQVVVQVLHVDLTPELFNRLERAAATVRGK
jgi:shikimate 5-dehydrogenase